MIIFVEENHPIEYLKYSLILLTMDFYELGLLFY